MSTSMKLNPYDPRYNTYMPQGNPAMTGNLRSEEDKYIVTTKIMVLALAVLFAVVFFVVCLHIYAKWIWSTNPDRAPASFSFWPRRRRNRASSSSSPGNDVVMDADALDINMVMGLGKSAVDALPKFRYHVSSSGPLECAICLGKFEEGELGRALPKCGHSFHLECIDMWLFSHSTCPLCRAILDPDEPLSQTLDSPSHLEPLTPPPQRPRGFEPDHSLRIPPLPPPDHPAPSQSAEPVDPVDKRADSIPANVLFWGHHTQHTAESRILNNNNNGAGPTLQQLVIDIDIDQVDMPTGSSPFARSIGGGSFHRLLGRGRLVAEDGEEMRVTPFRPSPSPLSSSSSLVVLPSPSRS